MPAITGSPPLLLDQLHGAEKNWLKLRGFANLAKIIEGVKFVYGEETEKINQAVA